MSPTSHQAIPTLALTRELGLRDLVLFSFVGVSSTRGAALAAQTGFSSITLWVAAVIFFFIPSAFAVARLSARFPQEGGLYIWTRECFGEWNGFLCFWVYWLSLAFLFPSALMASSSMAVYALGAHYVHLAGSRAYVFGASLAALALITIANLVGLKFGKWLDNIGAVAAYLLCVAMTITAVVILRDHGSATPVNLKPQLNWAHMSFWAQIAFALTGLELAPILGGEIKNPERNLPRASLLAAPLAASYYILGTVALLVILPSAEIRPLNGIAQSAFAAAQITRFSWIGPTAAMLLIGAAIGQLMVFGAAASRLPYVLGANRMLPHALSRVHPRWHTPYASILFFGVLAVIFLSLAQLGDTLGGAFQTLLDLMAIAGLTPFLYIFAAAWKCGSRWSAISGAVVTAFAVVASLAPTAEIASVWRFELKLLGLSACLVISARILYNRSKRAP